MEGTTEHGEDTEIKRRGKTRKTQRWGRGVGVGVGVGVKKKINGRLYKPGSDG